MFFDRLLKLQTLKFRLLGSTSFAQLYSAERLPLRKFRKEGTMLSPLIAGLLAACGGGGGGGVIPIGRGPDPLEGDESVPGQTIFDATGSQIEGAKFYVDANSDGVLSQQERDAGPLGTSNAEGQIAVDNDDLLEKFGTADELSIIADLEGARNLDTGEVFGAGDQFLTTITKDAVGSMQVLSSLTTLIELLKKNGQSEAEALETLFGDDTKITAEDLDKPELYDPLPSSVTPAVGSSLDKPAQISKVAEAVGKVIEAVGAERAAEAIANGEIELDSRADGAGDVVTITDTNDVDDDAATTALMICCAVGTAVI